jgi:hypothetical protein
MVLAEDRREVAWWRPRLSTSLGMLRTVSYKIAATASGLTRSCCILDDPDAWILNEQFMTFSLLEEMFEAPDIRPLGASDISAANRRHDEMLAHTSWFKLWAALWCLLPIQISGNPTT